MKKLLNLSLVILVVFTSQSAQAWEDNYDEPLFRKHLMGAIKWVGRIK
jgi:hypothetical protein